MSSPRSQKDDPQGPKTLRPGDPHEASTVECLLQELRACADSVGESWPIGEATRLGLLASELKVRAQESGKSAVCAAAAELEAALLAEEAQASAMCEKVEALDLADRAHGVQGFADNAVGHQSHRTRALLTLECGSPSLTGRRCRRGCRRRRSTIRPAASPGRTHQRNHPAHWPHRRCPRRRDSSACSSRKAGSGGSDR